MATRIRTVISTALTVATVLLLQSKAHAILMVDATVTPVGGGLFHYDVFVSNTGPNDVSIVSITDAPQGDADISGSLLAPAGFLASYDPGLGFIDLLEDTSLFGVGTTNGAFAFDSMTGPGLGFISSFEALTTLGDPLTGVVQTRISAVPEPGMLALMAFGLALFGQGFAPGRARQPRDLA